MNSEVETTLSSLAELLNEYGETSWGSALARLAEEHAENPGGVAATVIGMYGGMGGFNDITLYRDGSVAVDATEKLDAMRHQLFAACRSKF